MLTVRLRLLLLYSTSTAAGALQLLIVRAHDNLPESYVLWPVCQRLRVTKNTVVIEVGLGFCIFKHILNHLSSVKHVDEQKCCRLASTKCFGSVVWAIRPTKVVDGKRWGLPQVLFRYSTIIVLEFLRCLVGCCNYPGHNILHGGNRLGW